MYSFAKTITYGCTHIFVAFAVTWTVTGNLNAAIGISLIEPLFQIGAYFVHEKAWIKFGKKSAIAADQSWDLMPPCCHHTAQIIKKHIEDKE